MIPDGWRELNIARLASEPVSYGVVQTGDPVDDGIPCVRVIDLASGDPTREKMITTSRAISDSYKRTVLKTGDVMIALRGIIGRAALVPPQLAGCNLTRGIARISPDKSVVRSDFLFHSLNGPEFQGLINSQANGSALQEVSIATLRSATIMLPALPEQRRIAEILSTWDCAIETVEALIAGARAQKKALMQSLLTGKHRLPLFSGAWTQRPIGDLVREVNRNVEWDDDAIYKLISVRRRSEGIFHRESLSGHQILTKSMKIANKGDFLISKMQVVHGASALVRTEFDGFNISGSYIALVPKDVSRLNIEYFDWFSRMPEFRQLAYFSSYGVHIEKMTFNLSTFLRQKIALPSDASEQSAIVERLDAAEAGIRQAEQQLAALRQEKSALMQQLLTGKRRVQVDVGEEVHA